MSSAVETQEGLSGGEKLVARITALDRSSQPFHDQLDEAYAILGLQVPTQSLVLDQITSNPEPLPYGPTVEWTFRWLLKRFNCELSPLSPCLYAEGWHFARRLIASIPNRVAAKALSGIPFVAILSKLLTWAVENGFSVDSGTVRRTKKRKRSTWAADQKDVDPILISAVLQFVQEIKDKCQTDDLGLEAFAAELLRENIRTDTAAASDLLARGLTSIHKALTTAEVREEVYKATVNSLCWIWESRETEEDDGDIVNTAFCDLCLVPSLEILHISQACDASTKVALELLVVRHCLTPLRLVYITHKSPKDRKRPRMRQLMSPYLTRISKGGIKKDLALDTKNSKGPDYHELATYLFTLAVKATPRNLTTPHVNKSEDEWICALFDMLSNTLTEFNMFSSLRECLRQILLEFKRNRIVLDDDLWNQTVRFGLPKESIKSAYNPENNLEFQSAAEWQLLGLCTEIRADLVVGGNTSESPLLDALDRVTISFDEGPIWELYDPEELSPTVSSRQSPGTDDDLNEASNSGPSKHRTAYVEACRYVLLPATNAFIQQRRLPQLLSRWKMGLRKFIPCYQGVEKSPRSQNSVWEDGKFIQCVADNVETSLTDQQIASEFESLVQILKSALAVNEVQNSPDDLQNDNDSTGCKVQLVLRVNVALLGRLTRPECLALMEANAKICFDSLRTLLDMPQHTNGHETVAFLATILAHLWPQLYLDDPKTPGKLIKKTSKRIRQALTKPVSPSQYRSSFVEFAFLHKLACSGQRKQESFENAKEAFRQVMNLVQDALSKILSTKGVVEPITQWQGYIDQIRGIRMFVLAVVSLTLADLSCLEHMPLDELQNFFNSFLQAAEIDAMMSSLSNLSEEWVLSNALSIFPYHPSSWSDLWSDGLLRNYRLGDLPRVSRALRSVLQSRLDASDEISSKLLEEVPDHLRKEAAAALLRSYLVDTLCTLGLQNFDSQTIAKVRDYITRSEKLKKTEPVDISFEVGLRLLCQKFLNIAKPSDLERNGMCDVQTLYPAGTESTLSPIDTHLAGFFQTILRALHSGSIAKVAQFLLSTDFGTLPECRYFLDRLHIEMKRSLNAPEISLFITEYTSSTPWSPGDAQLYFLLKWMGDTYSPSNHSEQLKSSLFTAISRVLNRLHMVENPDLALLCMNILNTALRKNPWAVGQMHIDGILTSVATLSRGNITIAPGRGYLILRGLVMMVGSVLAIHRIRTGGRHHLLVAACQGLLRCLYTPYNSKDHDQRDKIDHPRWLEVAVQLPSADQAAGWSRLVSTICDPPSSTVKTSKSSDLNDATKKARSIAGQHMQYVLMEFCSLQLKGKLEPEVREALNPGLYAMFDAMSSNVRATVNTALDAQGRAVYKAVYEDWKKFGKWDGD